MTTFIETFKAKAHSKSLTAADMLALCIYKTTKAKSEDKAVILTHFLKKSFSAGQMAGHRLYPYMAITNAVWYLNQQLRAGKKWGPDGWFETEGQVLGKELTEFFTEEEIVLYREITSMITPDYVKGL